MPSEPEPLSTPWSLNPAPEILSNIIVEWVDSENAPGSYVRLAPGTPYPDQEKFPGYIFLAQQTISQNKVKRYWCTPAFYNEDVYDYARDYVSDSSTHPIFIRQYKTRRDQYTELTRGSGGVLSGVWLIKLTNAGSGYDPDNPPAVAIAGTGTGATAIALVNPDTSLSWIRITAEGSGYAGAVTVTIDPPSAGVQATATATIQATSCVLIRQTTQNFPEDDPRFGLFLLETRVYQTFPGPYIDRWDWEPRIERYVKVRKRLILSSSVPVDPNDETLPVGTTIEYQDITDVYSAEITTEVPADIAWEEGGDDYVYSAFVNHRFPDQIEEVPTIQVVAVLATTGFAADYGWDIRVKEGYAGPCVATVAERYTFDPTDAAFIAGLPAPTEVFPAAETVFIYTYGLSGDNPFARVLTFPVPLTLHPAYEILVEQHGTFTGMTVDWRHSLTATVPTGFNSGDTMTVVSEPQRLGVGGLWVVRIITITHP